MLTIFHYFSPWTPPQVTKDDGKKDKDKKVQAEVDAKKMEAESGK